MLQNEIRCLRLINQAIEKFKLDLSGFVILTEAATNYYMLTPMIAALANADKVYAITRDSRYGKAADVWAATMGLAQRWGLSSKIEIILSREDPRIGDADIVTNLGFVRPLDKDFLHNLKTTAVIPLMWETWEYRPEDLDLAECRRLGIPVLGTNEHHSELRIFKYIGHIALKVLFEAGIEVFGSYIVVIGGGEFAQQTVKTLRAAGAQVTPLAPRIEGELTSAIRRTLCKADAVVVVEHHSCDMLIGSQGNIASDVLYSLNPGLVIVHICGAVERAALEKVGLHCYPERFAFPGYMSLTTDYLGPKPLIDLHTAGLTVGERMARFRVEGLPALQTESRVLTETLLAQGFVGYHHLTKESTYIDED